MKNDFDIIGFDADGTLWINQPNYDAIEDEYCKLFFSYFPIKEVSKELYNTEVQNISFYVRCEGRSLPCLGSANWGVLC